MVRHLEDFRVGDVYQLGSTRMCRAEIVQFAETHDPQSEHLDGVIASGWHVAVVFMRMYVTAVLRDAAADVSPGVDNLRWLRPVRPGDVLTGQATVLDIHPSLSRPECGIVRQRGRLTDEQDRVVMHLTFYGLIRRRA